MPGPRAPGSLVELEVVDLDDLRFGRGAVLLSIKGPASTEIGPGMLTQTYAVDAGASGGAPTGNRNARKHGRFSRAAINERRVIAAMLKQAKRLVEEVM